MVKAKDVRDLTIVELKEKARGLSQELFNLRFQKATGEIGNTAMIEKTKKDLARVKTVLREMAIPPEKK